MTIDVDPVLKEKLPALILGGLLFRVKVKPSTDELLSLIDHELSELSSRHTPESIRETETVKDTKNAYRLLGKDPNRYRPSAESLLRRVANGSGLYRISNVVDILNLVSVKTGYSICGYDFDHIMGSISLGIGEPEEPYIAIGRGHLNIESLPVFRDELSAFGTPTSDSVRTMVSATTSQFLLIFMVFGHADLLEASMEEVARLLSEFAEGVEEERFVLK
jgi:DNA/RNA-binding domain of Phe-tRNA-synthetase-like protein